MTLPWLAALTVAIASKRIMERLKCSRQDSERRVIPTLHPVPCHRAEKVGIKALWLLNSVQDFADVHHLGEMRDKNYVTSLLKKPTVLHCHWELCNSSVLIPGWTSTAACNAVNHHASRTQWHGSPVRGLWWRNFPAGLLSTIFIQLCGILEMILKTLQGPSSASSGSSSLTVVLKQSWGFGIWVEMYETQTVIFFHDPKGKVWQGRVTHTVLKFTMWSFNMMNWGL